MDLNNIRTFLRVVETGNFSRAAEELQYAQSTVTAQIQALEKELGFPLFERIGRKNHLTAEGKEFLRYANELQVILQKVSSVGQQPKDAAFSLRVGVLQSLLFHSFLEAVPSFRQTYPNAQLSVKVSNTLELQEMLRKNRLDMIYISAPPNTDPTLTCFHTQKTDMVVASGAGHELAGRRQITLKEVLRYPFILSDPSGQSYQTFHELVIGSGLTFQCPVTVNDNTAISILLRDNRSLSFLPRPSVSTLRTEGLAVLDVDLPPQPYYSQVLVRKSTWVSPAMEYLVSLIKNHSSEK